MNRSDAYSSSYKGYGGLSSERCRMRFYDHALFNGNADFIMGSSVFLDFEHCELNLNSLLTL